MPVKSLDAIIGKSIEEILAVIATKENIQYTIAIQLIPQPTGPPQAGVFIMLLLKESGLMDVGLMTAFGIPLSAATDEAELQKALSNGIEEMRNQRAQILASGNIPPPSVKASRPSGLIIPGV